MNSRIKILGMVLVVSLLKGVRAYGVEPDSVDLGQAAMGSAQGPWLFSGRLGSQFTDNRDGVKTNKESNTDVYVEPRVDYRFRDGERTMLDLSIFPMVKWHSNPRSATSGQGQNDYEYFGSAAVNLTHQLSPRIGFGFSDSLTYNDDPQVNNGGTDARSSDNHYWNIARMELNSKLSETLESSLEAEYSLKRYTDSVVANQSDEDTLDGRAFLKYMTGAGYKLLGYVGGSEFKNKATDRSRGAKVIEVGAGVEKAFSPDLIGKVTGGYQHGEYDNSAIGSIDAPSAAAQLTMRAASETRFRVGANYGLMAANVFPYSVQTMFSVIGAIDHDILPKRLTASLEGQYGRGRYKSENVGVVTDAPGGTEELISVGLRANYIINRTWSVDCGYMFENWDTNVREPFSRDVVDVSVKAQI